jgi:chemotaxis-related protein WspB
MNPEGLTTIKGECPAVESLLLLFSVGPARYALPVDQIAEVVPWVETTAIPQAPPEVLGLCNCRGRALVVIDLHYLLQKKPCPKNISSRIMILGLVDKWGQQIQLGLLAEKVTETQRYHLDEFVEIPLALPDALQLGPVRLDESGQVQLVQSEKLLTEPILEMLRMAPHL